MHASRSSQVDLILKQEAVVTTVRLSKLGTYILVRGTWHIAKVYISSSIGCCCKN
jgi:hypothetical protein